MIGLSMIQWISGRSLLISMPKAQRDILCTLNIVRVPSFSSLYPPEGFHRLYNISGAGLCGVPSRLCDQIKQQSRIIHRKAKPIVLLRGEKKNCGFI